MEIVEAALEGWVGGDAEPSSGDEGGTNKAGGEGQAEEDLS